MVLPTRNRFHMTLPTRNIEVRMTLPTLLLRANKRNAIIYRHTVKKSSYMLVYFDSYYNSL